MWSFVGSKQHPRWLWEALDHRTGRIVAYIFGRRADRVLVKLKALLAPFGIRRFYTDGWGAYRRHLDPQRHMVGKRRTQQLERKHLTWRPRIKRLGRKTICFPDLSRCTTASSACLSIGSSSAWRSKMRSIRGTPTELVHYLLLYPSQRLSVLAQRAGICRKFD